MPNDLSSKCRTCLGDSNFFHQLLDYVDENYKILEMLDGIVPQIGIKCNKQFSTFICQPCVDRLLTGYKFQQLCIDTNNRLQNLVGIAIVDTEPKLKKILDPLTGEPSSKLKQEVEDDGCYERGVNLYELGMSLKSDNDNDWKPPASRGCSTESRLNKIKSCKKSFSCKQCGKVLSSYNRLKTHESMHTEKILYSSGTRNKTLFAEKTLKAHILTHNIEQRNCQIIKTDSESCYVNDIEELSEIKEVYKIKTPASKMNTEKEELGVFVKEEMLITPQIFEEHTEKFKKNGEWINNDCEDKCDNSEEDLLVKPTKSKKNYNFVNTCIGEVEKPNSNNRRNGCFPCDVCGKIFDRPSRLKRHTSVHSLTKLHECEICKYRFATANILKTHLSQHQNCTFGNLASQSRPEGFKCPDCPRRFEKQASLSAHRQTHTRNSSETNYPCIVCERKFTTIRYLTEHVTNKHPDVERHNCDQCEKTFILYDHLVEHLNRHKGYNNTLKEHMGTHSSENPCLCPQCGKIFRSASNLQQHIERHTGLKKYQCLQCPSRFNCRSDLTKHTSTHTKDKPHVCDICGSRFTRAYSLQKHKLLHSGERPFKCDQCTMTFAVMSILRQHMRTHTGEKPFKCKYCERAYAASGDLTKHLRSHIGENTYMCDQCPMAFKYLAELKEHQSEHYIMAQKLLQKMSSDAQPHKINDNQNI